MNKIDKDKNKAKTRLKNLIIKYERNRNSIESPDSTFNETDTREQYINPLLEAFGWDVENRHNRKYGNQDVDVEHYVPRTPGNTHNQSHNRRTDYSLRKYHKRVISIEAEKPSKDLDRDMEPTWQVKNYGWHLGNRIGILTNFKCFKIFTTTAKPPKLITKLLHKGSYPKGDYRPYKEVSYKDYIKRFNLLWTFLAKDSVYSGKTSKAIDKITPDNADKTSLNYQFLSNMESWRKLIAKDLLCNSVYRSIVFRHIRSINHLLQAVNDDTQTFINQLVFLRFAEDNSLEGKESLKKTFINATTFDKYLHKLDKKYNSGIFHKCNITKYLSKLTIDKLREDLYPPKSPYDFSIISLRILGRIYEQFIQEKIGLTNNIKNIKELNYITLKNVILRKIHEASVKSVVPTPTGITSAIVNESIGRKIKQIHSVKGILQLRIADLAVGSGGFLIAAYKILAEKIIRINAKNMHIKPSFDCITFNEKRELISKVLYGVDINKHASEVTKFSLALHLLKHEDSQSMSGIRPIIPSMDNNILSFNSLLSDINIHDFKLKNNLTITKNMRLHHYDYIYPRTSSNSGSFTSQKFDIIIGNPPYLKTGDMKKESKLGFEICKSKYITAYKQFDKYFLFIEQSFNFIKSDGVISFIIPDKFIKDGSARKLREFLYNHRYLSKIIDFGQTQLFNNKTVYVAIVLMTKASNKYLKYSEINTLDDINNTKYYVNFSYGHGNSHKHIYPITTTVAGDPWILTSNVNILQFYLSLKKYPKITDVIDDHNGIETSANGIYLINKNQVKKVTKSYVIFIKNNKVTNNIPKLFKIERNICKPFRKPLRKKHNKPFITPRSNNLVIFPYKNDRLIKKSSMKKQYPKAWKYLNYFKNILKSRNIINGEWYSFGRNQALNYNIWNKPKLIIQGMSKIPTVMYDPNGLIVASGSNAGYIPLYLKNSSKFLIRYKKNGKICNKLYSIYYIEAWLNYPLVDDIFKLLTTKFRGDLWSHGTNIMPYIPFLSINGFNKRELKLYKNIISYTKKLNKSNCNNYLYLDCIIHDITNLLNIKGLMNRSLEQVVSSRISLWIKLWKKN